MPRRSIRATTLQHLVVALVIIGCLSLAWSAYAAPDMTAEGNRPMTSFTDTPTTQPTSTTVPTATATTQPTATATTQATATGQPTATAQATVTATAQPTATHARRTGAATGGHIDLSVSVASGGSAALPIGAWSAVQWQDGAGEWHDIAGWSGYITATDGASWWVDPKDFGTGPFRWCLYDAPGGTLTGVSEPFNLPARAGENLTVTIGPVPTATAVAQ